MGVSLENHRLFLHSKFIDKVNYILYSDWAHE